MRHRPVAVLPALEYPRPVMPAGLDEDQQDELLDRMMTQLMTGRPEIRRGTPVDVEVHALSGDDWSTDDDVLEF